MAAKKTVSKKKPAIKKSTAKRNPLPQSKYNSLLHPSLIFRMANEGFMDEKIAKMLGICRKTLHNWKILYPEVDDALTRGKENPNEIVINDIFICAHGYYYTEEVAKFYRGKWHKTTVRKYKPKSELAQIWMSKNCCGWRDRHEIDLNQPITIILPNDPRAKKLVKKGEHGNS